MAQGPKLPKRPKEPVSVEKDLPVPRRNSYPWNDMEVGDSFFLNYCDNKRLMANRVAASMTAASKRLGRKFTLRTTSAGVRVWRKA
jgi:hypothetical protein